MQNKIIAIAAAATLGFLSTSALAAPVTAQNTTNNSYAYVGVQSGLNLLHVNDSSLNTDENKAGNKNTKAGFAVGGVMGYSFNPYLRSDVSVDYLRNAQKQTDIMKKDGSSIHTNQLFVLANVYGSYPVSAKFSPFAGIGIGYAHIANITKVSKKVADADTKTDNPSANGLGLQATAGVNYAVTSSLDLGASYRMLIAHTGEPTAKDTPKPDSKDKNHLTTYNNVIGMSLSYRLPM